MFNRLSQTNKQNFLKFNPTKLDYVWDLEKDLIYWQEPFIEFLGDHSSIMPGADYFYLLSFHDFWHRMATLSEKRFSQKTFSLSYPVHFPTGIQNVLEEGKIELDANGNPSKIRGCLTIIEEGLEEKKFTDYSGYSPLTHLPGPDLFFENLSALRDQTKFSKSFSWAFMVITVSNLTYLNCKLGFSNLKNLIQQLSINITVGTRFGDFIGQCHAANFGIIAKDCDEKGMESLSKRLIKIIDTLKFSHRELADFVKITIGGIVSPVNDFDNIQHLIKKAQRNVITFNENNKSFIKTHSSSSEFLKEYTSSFTFKKRQSDL